MMMKGENPIYAQQKLTPSHTASFFFLFSLRKKIKEAQIAFTENNNFPLITLVVCDVVDIVVFVTSVFLALSSLKSTKA